jgi:hypothetical protein
MGGLSEPSFSMNNYGRIGPYLMGKRRRGSHARSVDSHCLQTRMVSRAGTENTAPIGNVKESNKGR